MKIRLHILAALAAASLSFQALADCVAVEAAPASAPAATPADAPAPIAASPSAPAVAAAAGSTVVPRAVTLRDRPKTDSMGSVVAPADKPVRLEHSVSNSDGNWWYVTASGLGGGWVLESELGKSQQP